MKEFKSLDVSVVSISDLKGSPMTIFEQSKKEKGPIYVFNRDKVAGVVLDPKIYEMLIRELEASRNTVKDLLSVEKVKGDNYE